MRCGVELQVERLIRRPGQTVCRCHAGVLEPLNGVVRQRVAAVFRDEPEKVADSAMGLTAALTHKAPASAGPVIDDKLLKDLDPKPAVNTRAGQATGAIWVL